MNGIVFFMYHEVQVPGRELCDDDPGSVLYVVTEEEFTAQLDLLQKNGWQCLDVTGALRALAQKPEQAGKSVCLTFDDGCATDLLVAAPLLRARGFSATCYVTFEHLGRRGYLTEAQLRELADQGFEVGSHAMTHRYLNDLDARQLEVEIAGSKERLEQITGRRVAHFSCPGGRVTALAQKIAKEAGYESVATSRLGGNGVAADRFSLARVPVKRGMPVSEFARLCDGEGLRRRQAETAVLKAAKRVLGNKMYERLRSSVLGRGPA